jgi:ribosomal-protein-alanine N-acetyltransferase
MESILLKTRRLLLRSATPEIAAADLGNRSEFSRLLAAHIPEDWPPPLNDDNSKAFTLSCLEKNPDAAGWSTWYFLLPGEMNGKSQAIGIGGFREKPSQGTVEVGYSILPAYQRLGFASEAVSALIDWAFSHSDIQLVTAETLPALLASIRVLEKNGFQLLGEGSEEGAIRYGRKRRSG